MGSAIRKIGNSAGVILPKPVLETLGAKLGDTVEFITEGSTVRIEAVKSDPREGWEEDSRRLGEQGMSEGSREWLEAPLNAEADSEWEWDGKW